jgi:hypothetical protein
MKLDFPTYFETNQSKRKCTFERRQIYDYTEERKRASVSNDAPDESVQINR